MKIDVVVLENVRSHVKSTVPFTHGFNCVVGGVGCGKSSLLYAVDFALFGDTLGGRSFEYLLREGCDQCKVTLQFTQNGGTYKLVRGLRRRGKSIIQDIEQLKLYEDERLVASMKTDAIAEQLRAITGLDRDIYREIVWFRQEHLKELLDAKPRDRQTRLDTLFGLADYEAAWTNLAQYRRDYDNELSFFQKDPDVNSIEKLNFDYNHASEEFALIEMDLENAAQRVARAKNGLDEAEADLKLLENKKLAIDELKRLEAQLNANVANVTRNLVDLGERVEGKKVIIDNLVQRQTSLDSQMKQCLSKLEQAGLSTDQQLEQLTTCLSGFDEKITTLRAEQEATSRSIQQDQKRLLQLGSGGGECPVCSQPLSGEYRTDLLLTIQHENAERERTINRIRIEVATLQKTKTIASEAVGSLQNCLTRSGDLKVRLAEEEINLKKLTTDLEMQQRKDVECRAELELLQQQIAAFDMSELQLAKDKKDQAVKAYYAVQADLQTKQNRKIDLGRRLDDIKGRIDVAQQKLERMDKIRRTIELLSAIRDAYRSIQPKLRAEYVKVLRNFVQQILDSLVGGETPMLNVVIDETYTPYVKSEVGVDREVSNLSGGERTLLAFAYRLGLGQLIMQSRTGHGLSMLMLDEPTENLGSEDGSIERLADAISRFKAIEQIVAVTHSEAFAAKGDHVVVLEKEAGVSKLSIER
jgi:exonuclease SbcC